MKNNGVKKYFFILFTLILFIKPTYALVQINNLADYAFGNLSPPYTTVSMIKNVCVYNSASDRYRVRATGLNNVAKNQRLKRTGSAVYIIYAVNWSETTTAAFTKIDANGFLNANGASSVQNCTSGTFARLQIQIAASALSGAVNGTYTDTLSIIIEPR